MKKILLLFMVLLLACTQIALAQARRVKGRVLDETGQGLIGAGISVKNNSQIGTVTDVDGNFELDVPEGSNILVVQAISYNSREISIPVSNIVTVRMASSATQLEGAVVTALAVKREKRELGYSVSTLSNDDLTGGNNTSAISSIQGKTSGVNITSSTGGPGGSSRIVLRGEKSFSGGSNALMVVDGIIISNNSRLRDNLNSLEQVDFGNGGNDINPDDIESITVLKGPTASALYGSLGANGAIIITTKTGKVRTKEDVGKTEITVKSTFMLSDVLKYPEYQNTYGQGNIYQGVADDRRENFSWGAPFDGELRPWGQVINGQQKVKPYEVQKDNIKSFYNKGKTYNNYISLAGGSEKSTYFLSLQALNNTGIIPNTFYDKYSIRFNGSTQLSNKFYTSINVNYINTYSRVEAGGQSPGSVIDNLIQTPRDIPIWELKDLNDPFNGYGIKDEQGVEHYGYYGAYAKNPYWVAQNFDNRAKTDRLLGAYTIGYKANDHLNIYDRFGGDVLSDRAYYKTPKYSYEPFDPFYAGNNQILAGGYEESTNNLSSLYNDLIVQYTKPLSENINLDVLAGHNLQMSTTNFLDANIDYNTNNLVIPGFYNLSNAGGPILATNRLDRKRRVGVYGDFKVGYKNAFFVELTARNDWSSTLKPGNNSYFYPSANVSWVFTKGWENGFTRKVLTYGKLRGGYASVGNDANPYDNNNAGYEKAIVKGPFGNVIVFPFNGQPGYQYQSFIGNPDLVPERTNSREIGTDLSFFSDRLALEFTYYHSNSIDQIIEAPAPPSSGFPFQKVNSGNIENKGIELGLRATPIKTSNFRWELFGTYTRNKNTVLSIVSGADQLQLGGTADMQVTATIGRPYGAFYAIDLLKDDQGRVVIDPVSGLPLKTPNAVYKGSYQPKFIASWGTNLSFKGFRLNMVFVTKQGGKFFSRTKDIMDFVGTAKETESREEQIWPNSVYMDPNSGQYVANTQYKYSPYNYFTNLTQTISGVHVIDASYVKLQEMSITYTIPKKTLNRTPFGGLQVGVFGNNLFIWTAKENMYDDPEMSSGGATSEQGFNFTARPSLRNYGVSLQLTF